MDFLDFINKADTSDYGDFLRSRAKDNAANYAKSQEQIFRSFFDTYDDTLDKQELVVILVDALAQAVLRAGEEKNGN